MKITQTLYVIAVIGLAGCVAKPPAVPALSANTVSATQSGIIDGTTSLTGLIQQYGVPSRTLWSPQGKQIAVWMQNWAGPQGQQAAQTTQLTALINGDVVEKHWVHRYPVGMQNSFLSSDSKLHLNKIITKGVSTETGVIARLGEPRNYLFDDDGNKIMMYVWHENPLMAQGGATPARKMNVLLICLDSHNVVKFFNIEQLEGSDGIQSDPGSAFSLDT
ncbi:hypothetical protein [Mangrovibacter plantisponsor]|uniref:Lipoprotein n=1 Tax=Mangrovibacter plantisponsor TaxID=451513 RepID=A0A317PYJ5_9ENTR|nr:hypothetical protein [Mangrovibacter plantisponsor]PWW08234.1 hypothetical protein DES37_107281 [Mangrovibacter plantisponsor]